MRQFTLVRRIRHRRNKLLRFEALEPRQMLNGLPVAVPDPFYSSPVNTALTLTSSNDILENDSDPEGSALTASMVTNPNNDTITNFSSSAGTFTYTPSNGYLGVDTFTYKVNDGTSDSNIVVVSIAVGGHFGPRINLEGATRANTLHGATDVPSWAKGEAVNESGKDFAKRLCDEHFGKGKYDKDDKGVGSDYNQMKKWGDRHFH